MRKLYLLICMVGLSLFTFGQTYVLEDFSSNQMPPSGWTIDNLAAQWSINSGANAGGIAPEGMFTWVSGVSTSRLILPEVDLSGLDEVSFQFAHFLDDYSGSGYTLGVATRADGGTWNTVWSTNPTGNIGPETVSLVINNDDVNSENFQVCIYIDGNTYNLDYWYIDDIWLFTPLDLDAALSAITTPTFLGAPAQVTGSIKNFGSNDISSAEISWQVDDGDITTSTFDGLSVAFGESYEFTCDGMIELPIGSYTLSVWIETINGTTDEDPTNDLKEKSINFVSHTTSHKPTLEEFTSSTCAPCASFNTSFVPWCNDHAEDITLVKYQMNWPGVGDPYYTEEGGVRRNWYGVSWVPWTNLDGTYTDNNMGTIQSMFDASLMEPALIKLIGANSSVTGEGTIMDIDVTLLAFANFEDVMVHIVVFENITTQNVATNGETEFEHVMMKMVPDASGTITDLEDRVPLTISESIDLAGTNVEEWDDLGVAVIVQDQDSKYIWQSGYTVEDGTFANDASLTAITVDGEPLEGFSPDIYEYTVTLASTAVEVPLVEATVTDPNGLSIVVPAIELPGATTVDVFAEDLATKNTYTINFDLGTGIGNETFDALNVYPNPSNGIVYISGADNAQVTVFNAAGAVVAAYKNFNSGKIDLSSMEEGIYFLNIIIDNKTTINKKISILK